MKPDNFFDFDAGPVPDATMQQAVIFHRATNVGENPYYGRNYFLASLHDVKTGDNHQQVIGAGRLLSKEDIESMLKLMLDMKPAKPFLIPQNVLSYSEQHIMWAVKGGVKPMLFNLPGKPIIKLTVPWPNLLFLATRSGKLFAFALKSKTRPSGKTRLFNAPLMNVGYGGEVCAGTGTVPDNCTIDTLAAWESVMFDTAFSHVNNNKTLQINPSGHVDTTCHFKFWKDLSKRKAEIFPNDFLVPSGRTLDSFLQGVLR